MVASLEATRSGAGPGLTRAGVELADYRRLSATSEAECLSAIHPSITLVRRACDIAPGTVRGESGIANGESCKRRLEHARHYRAESQTVPQVEREYSEVVGIR